MEIYDSNITTLSQKTFLNTPIEEFLFGFSNFTRGITVEAFVLEGMANTLRHLQLKNCLDDPQVVHNLTGGKMIVVDNLDFITAYFNCRYHG